MSFYGDPTPLWSSFLGEIIAIDMPTAIIRYYCADGFLVATDGLALNSDDGTTIDKERQKVFPLPGTKAAFSITGSGTLGRPGKDATPQFDFVGTLLQTAEATPPTWSCRTLAEYARKLGKKVGRELLSVHQRVGLDLPTESREGERGCTIADIFIDGYLDGYPSRATLRFYHEDGKIQKPLVNGSELNERQKFYSGSKIVASLYEADERFAELKKPIDAPISEGLKEAASCAQQYILACESLLGREIDAKACRTIGGRIRMATITKDLGFQWVKGFGLDE
jgi:hypothetical protein